jgi:DNA-binding MarR family transcriptional regulator
MAPSIDLARVAGCTCLRLRRATRLATRLYDQALEPAHLTINQFGLLAHLYGAREAGQGSLAIGVLAERLGTDPTTLNRNLKPLLAQGLVDDQLDPADRRVRRLALAARGAARLREAAPLWQAAQSRLETALGREPTLALNGLLDLSSARLAG